MFRTRSARRARPRPRDREPAGPAAGPPAGPAAGSPSHEARAPSAAWGSAAQGSAAARTASALHAFNRFEIKYLVHEDAVPELRAELTEHLDTDENGPRGGYPVTSLYYDTEQLRFYWEKIEGLRFRRKLRLRYYGDRSLLTDTSPVYVEIKQRVNRVTQKRRVCLPFDHAVALCAGHLPEDELAGNGFVHEVASLVGNLGLKPTVITGYHREAFIGRDVDLGLRVTIDHRLHGRDRDLHLGAPSANAFIIPPHLAVLELKADERVPTWVTDLTARMNLQVVRISKYCRGVEAFGRAPRSARHAVADLLDGAPGPATTDRATATDPSATPQTTAAAVATTDTAMEH